MKTLTFEVTKKHISEGIARKCQRCPLAKAIKDATKNVSAVYVGLTTYSLEGKDENGLPQHYSEGLSKEKLEFRERFDSGLPVEPRTFTLMIPEWVEVAS